MTKQLIIVRHGKSSNNNSDIKDIDRTLLPKGIIDTKEIAKKLKDNNIVPDIIISSPANRALHTTTIICRTLKFPYKNINVEDLIYYSYSDEIIKLIKETDDSINSLMIVGHNPTLTDIANHFLNNPIFDLPTNGVVVLDFNCNEWINIKKKKLVSEAVDYPDN